MNKSIRDQLIDRWTHQVNVNSKHAGKNGFVDTVYLSPRAMAELLNEDISLFLSPPNKEFIYHGIKVILAENYIK